MKKIYCLLLLLAFLFIPTAEANSSNTKISVLSIEKETKKANKNYTNKNTKTVTVPQKTKVTISLKRKKSQKTINNMTLVAIIKEDVYVNGKLVFKEDDIAKINVEVNEKAKFLGKGGTLILNGGYATDAKGKKRKINFYKEYKGKDETSFLKYIFFKKGENITLYTNEEFEVTTKETFKF